MNRIRKAILIHVVLPLLAGFLIYLFFRSDTWFHQAIIPAWKIRLQPDHSTLGSILKFHFPDFCWSYSFTSALLQWKYRYKIKLPWFGSFILTALAVSEIVQVLLKPAFTFDWLDLVAVIAAFFLSSWFLKSFENG